MNYMNYNSNYNPNYQQQSNLNWVQGEAAARAWMVAPNNTILLMDSDEKRFYIKSADSSGMPSMRIFTYTEVTQGAVSRPNESMEQFVTHDEIDAIYAKIEAIEGKLKTKRGVKDAETDA